MSDPFSLSLSPSLLSLSVSLHVREDEARASNLESSFRDWSHRFARMVPFAAIIIIVIIANHRFLSLTLLAEARLPRSLHCEDDALEGCSCSKLFSTRSRVPYSFMIGPELWPGITGNVKSRCIAAYNGYYGTPDRYAW